MKFTMTSVLAVALATVVSSTPIEKRDALPAKLTLTSSTTGLNGLIYNELMYANSSAYIGNIKYAVYSENLKLDASPNSAGFTSIHASPTGQQRLYIFPAESKPIGFTVPHSAAVPEGASTIGFGDYANAFKYDGGSGEQSLWKACPVGADNVSPSWQIYWDGAATLADCVAVDLSVVADTCA